MLCWPSGIGFTVAMMSSLLSRMSCDVTHPYAVRLAGQAIAPAVQPHEGWRRTRRERYSARYALSVKNATALMVSATTQSGDIAASEGRTRVIGCDYCFAGFARKRANRYVRNESCSAAATGAPHFSMSESVFSQPSESLACCVTSIAEWLIAAFSS